MQEKNIFVTEIESAAIEHLAAKAGLSSADYIALCAIEKVDRDRLLDDRPSNVEQLFKIVR